MIVSGNNIKRWYAAPCTALLLAAALSGCAAFNAPQKKAPEFEHLVAVIKPIDKVPIIVSFDNGLFFHVQVQNSLANTITLIWDESSYVNTRKESIRLIRITDRNNLPASLRPPQADSPIAPDSELQADFMGESWIELARSGGLPKPKDGMKRAKIYLRFNIKGKRVDWQGEVAFVAKKSKSN